MTDAARVLIADGDEQLRALLYKELLDRDVFCDCAASAHEALEQLSQRHYSLIVLHLEMENSIALIEAVRAMPARQRPMVLATAEVRTPKDQIDTELVQIIVRRPVKVGELAGLIRSCLEYVPPPSDGS
jgi:CheY-like chemotaxis protein